LQWEGNFGLENGDRYFDRLGRTEKNIFVKLFFATLSLQSFVQKRITAQQ